MKVRFQADADLDEDIIAGAIRREPEIDFKQPAKPACVAYTMKMS